MSFMSNRLQHPISLTMSPIDQYMMQVLRRNDSVVTIPKLVVDNARGRCGINNKPSGIRSIEQIRLGRHRDVMRSPPPHNGILDECSKEALLFIISPKPRHVASRWRSGASDSKPDYFRPLCRLPSSEPLPERGPSQDSPAAA